MKYKALKIYECQSESPARDPTASGALDAELPERAVLVRTDAGVSKRAFSGSTGWVRNEEPVLMDDDEKDWRGNGELSKRGIVSSTCNDETVSCKQRSWSSKKYKKTENTDKPYWKWAKFHQNPDKKEWKMTCQDCDMKTIE